MSSRRELKKHIKKSFDLLFVDCIFYKVYVVGADKDAADKVLFKIIDAQDDLIKRISATEGKEIRGRIKAYYQKLQLDLKKEIDAIGKEIATLS